MPLRLSLLLSVGRRFCPRNRATAPGASCPVVSALLNRLGAGLQVDPDVVARVLRASGTPALFELGNEVYDPRQGPQPGGYATAGDYLRSVSAVQQAIRNQGGKAGIVLSPYPFFYYPGAPGWGPRYKQWNEEIAQSCPTEGSCPFDAVVVHNYRLELALIKTFAPGAWMEMLLTLPEASLLNADASLERFPPEVKLWLTEVNGMFAGTVSLTLQIHSRCSFALPALLEALWSGPAPGR